MNPHEFDITHTVKSSVANGRRLFKNLLTGETRWEDTEPVPGPDPTVVPVKMPKRGKKHKGEGDA